MSRIYNLKNKRLFWGHGNVFLWKKVSVNMFFWKILEVSIFGRLVCTYCLLKYDMPFVSGSYVTEVNDYIEKSGFFFSKS